MTLGIGIITYNRQKSLIRTAGAVMFHTKSPYFLVVADDGSTDDTVCHCNSGNITVVTGNNRGVCWNKNRALLALQRVHADPIILLEDDCYPVENGWEHAWMVAAIKYDHVNYVHPEWPTNWCRGGSGTADDPWLSWEITGQATITSQRALYKVGYLDTRFKGYGYGHINWTERFCKAGFIARDRVPCLRGGLEMEDGPTFRNMSDVRRNYHLGIKLRNTGEIYQPPGQEYEEYTEIMGEVGLALKLMPLEVRNAGSTCTTPVVQCAG